MKAITEKSIRIGNILDVDGNYWHVDSILSNPFELYFKENPEYDHALNAKPIKITHEKLLMLGFKGFGRIDMPRTLSYEFDWIQIFPSNSFCDFEGYGFLYYKPDPNLSTESARVKLDYIHELQNLIHDLTGKELEFKL